jgi:hypothetical protein
MTRQEVTDVDRRRDVAQPGGEVPRWLPHVLRAVAIGLGAVHAVAAARQQSMNEDGINYLDMGAAIVGGDWPTILNAIWSPLYAAILGIAVAGVQPSAWAEFPLVHAVNLAIFVVAMFCFEYFWRELTATYRSGAEPASRLPAAAWLVLGYSLWIWSSLVLISVWAVTPDMLVAACVYVAAGLLVRLARQDDSRGLLVGLGAVLGVGYLSKAAMFPLGLACLLLAAGILQRRARRLPRVAWAALGFAIVAGPMVVALSMAAGHLTFGDVGRFTYMKHVNRLRYPHWEETIAHVDGTPRHPPRQVLDSPPVYEFATPVPGTYPMSFDPGYWTRGLSPRIDLRQQVTAMASNGLFYFTLLVREQGVFLGLVLCLLACAMRPREWLGQAALVLWAVAAFGLYSVVYVTPRYVAPFVVMLWAGVLAGTRLPATGPGRRLASGAAWLLVVAVWINISAANMERVGKVIGFSPGLPSDPPPAVVIDDRPDFPADPDPAIAEGLRRVGLEAGDAVGFMGYSFSAFWARLARLRIVAELEPHHADRFWFSSEDAQSRVLQAFASTGVVAVVAAPPRGRPLPPGWTTVPGTEHAVFRLRE